MKVDIAIIGASSAGLHAASLLAGAGKRVVVFERQAELDPARRTLIITPQLKAVLRELPDAAILHAMPTMEVETPQASTTVKLNEADLIVERNHLAHVLAEQACAAGSEIRYGARFLSLEPHPDGALLHFKTRSGEVLEVVAEAVIGADGAFSDVAAAAGIDRPPTVPIVQAEVNLPEGWDPSVTKVWFDVDETQYFFWLIPESAQHGVVGLVGSDRAETRAILQKFLKQHGFEPLAYQSAQVAMHHPKLRPYGTVGKAPVLLVGDAAGQVKVSTVGGTVTGFWGAQAAARALIKGRSYASELRPLKRELDVHWFIRYMLERLDNAGYDRLVRYMNPSVRALLGQYNRDSMAGVFWRIPLLQPRFLLMALDFLQGKGQRYTARPTIQTNPSVETE